jgi:thioredoxin reductase
MNFRVDVMIVGDSKSGHEILDKLASSKPNIKVAFISQAFKSTTTHDYLNVKYFRDEVKYVSYRYRLFCCFMKNGDNIFSTHLIIASGLSYEPLIINGEKVPNVFNTVDDAPKTAKDQSALVICNQDSDTKFVLEVAKKYRQVYICTEKVNFIEGLSATTANKLAKTENLTVLPNTSIRKVISDKETLQKVELDNYAEIDCSAIFTKTIASPAIEFIPKKILSRENGYPVVSENCESTLVPGCFVVGTCLKKYTKAMEQRVISTILKDF